MKIIAYYLPQFHNIPENNEWWGEGFTEWVNVKKATPLYDGHVQPRVPLDNNYYDLLDDDVKIWQAKIAKEHGVYGFCYYHYWFDGKMLLEKPMEQMLANKKIDIPFCVCWANEPWTKAWTGEDKKVLINQYYGGKKEWKEHFDYMLPFFKDERYIKVDGKPLFVIYRPSIMNCVVEMMEYWRELAIESGFPGLDFAYQTGDLDFENRSEADAFEYDIEFQPGYARHEMFSSKKGFLSTLKYIRRRVSNIVQAKFGVDLLRVGTSSLRKITGTQFISYDKAWQTIINMKPVRKNSIPGAFVRWDNTPRHGKRGFVYVGENPEKFKKYLSAQIKHAKRDYKQDMMFMYAWNEWAEGGYLEPDEEHGYGYLKAIRDALKENNEFPEY
ncbi:MAG: glycoside hydrolase family 99-like domain-containing protein [Clostridia bacterium]|nr:glycoside hydrolase family 99-like domain-containing protein [Clostridia bacterium]